MSRMDIIREWDNKRLVAELRSPIRASLAKEEDSHTLLLAEAIARILETKTIKAVREIITERDKADKLREKCAGLGIEGILEQKRLVAAQKNIIATLGEGKAAAEERADKAEARVAEATNELHCCDDVVLDKGLTFGIANLREQRDSLAVSLRDVQETLTKQEWATYDQVCPICDEQPHHASCWLSALLTRLKEG